MFFDFPDFSFIHFSFIHSFILVAVERELQGNGDEVAGAHIHLQQPQLPGDLLAPGIFHVVGEGDE